MTTNPASSAAFAAAPLPVAPPAPATADALAHAARIILPHLERGQRVDAPTLRASMVSAFGGSDADGAWDWKTAYDACEAATILFLRKFGPAMLARAASPAAMLPMLAKIAGLLPTHTRRSEESQALQQFSTPIALGLAASAAAAITPADLVLEPSAGTGLLAILAELAGGSLVLNELAETRAGLLGHLFPGIAVTRFDAAQIHDHLDAGVVPSVVLMNPPFSALANVDRRMADAALRQSPRRSRVSPKAADWSRSPAQAARPTIRCGPMPSSGCRSAGASCSRPPSMDRLCQAWHDHRHAPDRDRPSARARSDGVSGLASCAPDAATLLGWIANSFRQGSRSPRRAFTRPTVRARRRTTAARCAAPFLRPGHDARAGGG